MWLKRSFIIRAALYLNSNVGRALLSRGALRPGPATVAHQPFSLLPASDPRVTAEAGAVDDTKNTSPSVC